MLINSKAKAALTLLLAINLFNYIDRYILSSTIAGIESDLLSNHSPDNKKALLGILATCFMASFMIFAPIFGIFCTKIKRWHLIGYGVVFWSIASGLSGLSGTVAKLNENSATNGLPLGIVMAFVGSYAFLALSRCMVGIGEASYGPIAPTILSDLYPEKSRGIIMSIFYGAIPVGSALGYAFGGIAGWPNAFYWVIPPGILLGFLCFLMPEPEIGAQEASNQIAKKIQSKDVFILLKTPSIIFNILGMTANTFAIGGIAYWFPYYVSVFRQNGTEQEAGIIMGLLIVISGLLATLFGGFAADYCARFHKGSYFLVSGIGMIIGFPVFLAVLYVPFPFAWVLIFVACFCTFINTGPTNAILLNVSPPLLRPMAFAITIFTIHALGDAISPWIIGGIADNFAFERTISVDGQPIVEKVGNLNAGFVTVSAMYFLAGLFWILGAKHLDPDTQKASASINV
ncbi:MAG: MFS transporter [Planctomycetes bacterium]|nr:MFS transporter [Planctomycetota bacterium]